MHVAVAGRLDGYWADHLERALGEVVATGPPSHPARLLEGQLPELGGHRVLVKFHKQLKRISGTFRVVNPSTPVVDSAAR